MNRQQHAPPRRSLPRRVARGAAVALLALNACYVWRPATLDPSHDFLYGTARISRTSGAETVVRGPRLVGDSILATATRTVTPVAIARTDVQRIEVRRLSRGRTAIAGIGIMAAYFALAWGFSDSAESVP